MKSASETVSYVTATALGKMFDAPKSAQQINQLLEFKGFHVKGEDGKTWQLTAKGAEVGVFVKIGNTGMIKWSPSVAAMLGARSAAATKKARLGPFAKRKA
ncbi:hypothetical protein QTH91_05890 [Variovorax dokdonensis]|uniref:Antirepressor protein C-terminal domain-containing protein n=1 Tax=Variovorax dokdonensis TaxID=344883 RepID=A0ABT7N7Z5_9BURK|nr:hypothetical protein [Variovorax dokdonensis]MDM0044005.1 hypothetical protein [Variovorax dokdonensis]